MRFSIASLSFFHFYLLLIIGGHILIVGGHKFIQLRDRNQQQLLPNWSRTLIRRSDWDQSISIRYLRAHRQAMNLYFELPPSAAKHSDGLLFHFSVAIDNMDGCSCVRDSLYENLLPFTFNRADGRTLDANRVLLLSWNFWHNQESQDGRDFFFSATTGNEFNKADQAAWTDLGGMHRQAHIGIRANGSVQMRYGRSQQAELDWLDRKMAEKLGNEPGEQPSAEASGRRIFRLRLISQLELSRMFGWLPGQIADGRSTPRCDWTLIFPSDYKLLVPVLLHPNSTASEQGEGPQMEEGEKQKEEEEWFSWSTMEACA